MSVLVSINCITYNHEEYIAKTIEGFINQETNFEYEILIHDDASTDRTAEIVKYYQNKYPLIIKPIYQSENQYSKGKKPWLINLSRAIGKYIAECEGDDYWIDKCKLQKQVDYMKDNPDCVMCFHNAELVDSGGNYLNKTLIDKEITNRKYTAGEIAVLGFIPTASKLYLKSTIDNPPEWYEKAVVGDYPSQLIVTSHGYAYYMDEVMSVYRVGIKGSATSKVNNMAIEEKVDYIGGFIDILNNFNQYSNYKYSKDIEQAILTRELQIIELKQDYNKLKEVKYKNYIKKMKKTERIKLFLRMNFRNIYMKLATTKNKIIFKFK